MFEDDDDDDDDGGDDEDDGGGDDDDDGGAGVRVGEDNDEKFKRKKKKKKKRKKKKGNEEKDEEDKQSSCSAERGQCSLFDNTETAAAAAAAGNPQTSQPVKKTTTPLPAATASGALPNAAAADTSDYAGRFGGWRPTLTPTTRSRCDVPIVPAAAMSSRQFARDFVYLSQPVLITGAMEREGWTNLKSVFSRSNIILAEQLGELTEEVGQVPYPSKFGLKSEETSLRAYVESYMPSAAAATRPPTANNSNDNEEEEEEEDEINSEEEEEEGEVHLNENKLSASTAANIPYLAIQQLQQQKQLEANFTFPSFARQFLPYSYSLDTQLFLGPEGVGAPMHFHNHAFNLVVFGAKRWYLLPPTRRVYSKLKTATWLDSLQDEQERPLECVQGEGELLYVPFQWAHGIINLGDTVSVTLEWGLRLEHLSEMMLGTVSQAAAST